MDTALAQAYLRFAELEAQGVSDTYEEWAVGVADDPAVLALIAQLPRAKRQANLVFAAARAAGAPVGPYPPFRDWLQQHWAELVPIALSHATQTNEAARCAVLLPVLSRLPGPLALIEAGASAGLCLYPDRYSYRYDAGGVTTSLDPVDGPSDVEIPCTIDAGSVPSRIPTVVSRTGVDLNPLDVGDPDQAAWLETLVWPEHQARRARLHAAARLVASDPPRLVRGDLLETVPRLIDDAPAESHVVVFHSAVLVYLDPERRARFVDMMTARTDITWISNEGFDVLPRITAQVPRRPDGRTILAVNGTPVALVGAHGQGYEAL